jgi:predicted phage tail protein
MATILNVNPPFSNAPTVGAPWVIQEDADGVRKFRVISISENEGKMTVLAALYNEDKFTATDNATKLSSPRISLAKNQTLPSVAAGSIVLGTPS